MPPPFRYEVKYSALACDYDGTLACNGVVSEPTIEALRRLRISGRKLLLVTGRLLGELLTLFPHVDLFERVVAENGGVLYQPASGDLRLLSAAPPGKFVDLLRERCVKPLSVGRVIVATHEPQQTVVLEVIHQLGLELQVIFNKGAVMVLPAGVNKATGLEAALRELDLAPAQVAAVGDAENDHALLNLCGFPAAVANAVPALKERAAWVAQSPNGAGVVDLVQQLLSS